MDYTHFFKDRFSEFIIFVVALATLFFSQLRKKAVNKSHCLFFTVNVVTTVYSIEIIRSLTFSILLKMQKIENNITYVWPKQC